MTSQTYRDTLLTRFLIILVFWSMILGSLAFMAGSLLIQPKIEIQTNTIIEYIEVPTDPTGVYFTSMDLPDGIPGTFKSWMNYAAITSTTTRQYHVKALAKTDPNGYRVINGKYLVAMASYYGPVGTELRITLSSGRVFYVIIGDQKSDRHTDPLNQYHLSDKSILEFIVDPDKFLNTAALRSGNLSNDGFEGAIVKIEKVYYS